MASFEAKVYTLEILDHPNADALELAKVGDYLSIVRKDEFQTGDLAVYIPEQAILPEWLIERLGLVGKLAGKNKDRVKAVKLRGILSQGLVLPLKEVVEDGKVEHLLQVPDAVYHVFHGEDVTALLDIKKYEPEIPVHMAGEVFNAHGLTLKYDIENVKKYPNVLEHGEVVVLTEKIHGTWTCLGWHPDSDYEYLVTSKGLSEKGLAFKLNDANLSNLYVRALASTEDGQHKNVIHRARLLFTYMFTSLVPFYLLGETFGKGVQDLHYGTTKPEFRLFDIYVGKPGEGNYLNATDVKRIAEDLNVSYVPLIHVGPYDRDMLEEFTSGNELISGTGSNIREGVVIRPQIERTDPSLGRVILKSVSDDYLLRKGKATEYQ